MAVRGLSASFFQTCTGRTSEQIVLFGCSLKLRQYVDAMVRFHPNVLLGSVPNNRRTMLLLLLFVRPNDLPWEKRAVGTVSRFLSRFPSVLAPIFLSRGSPGRAGVVYQYWREQRSYAAPEENGQHVPAVCSKLTWYLLTGRYHRNLFTVKRSMVDINSTYSVVYHVCAKVDVYNTRTPSRFNLLCNQLLCLVFHRNSIFYCVCMFPRRFFLGGERGTMRCPRQRKKAKGKRPVAQNVDGHLGVLTFWRSVPSDS